jgi:hypothetical protein
MRAPQTRDLLDEQRAGSVCHPVRFSERQLQKDFLKGVLGCLEMEGRVTESDLSRGLGEARVRGDQATPVFLLFALQYFATNKELNRTKYDTVTTAFVCAANITC